MEVIKFVLFELFQKKRIPERELLFEIKNWLLSDCCYPIFVFVPVSEYKYIVNGTGVKCSFVVFSVKFHFVDFKCNFLFLLEREVKP